jgi:ATP-dependent helicase HepA
MQAIQRKELSEMIRAGRGVVLVDKYARDPERRSTLHAANCPWVRRVGPITPIRFDPSTEAAVRWLTRTRGEEGGSWNRCKQCGGQAADAEPIYTNPREIGETIWVLDRGRDLAYVTEVVDDAVTVAEFDSSDDAAQASRRLAVSQTSRFVPAAREGCYIGVDGRWEPATVLSAPPKADSIAVLQNGGKASFSRRQVRFRHLQTLSNPVAALTGPLTGQASGFAARHRFLDDYHQLTAVSRGLTGITSAAVELHAHQVGVARRVLADPVQRYLLADEVGLGKTIEAGFVIRQRLIDAPRSNILVLVPTALIWQWEDELASKFRIHELRKAGINVDTYEEGRAFRQPVVPDLLVIDEAHRVAAGGHSASKLARDRYLAVQRLAHQVPRILLLSATPVLNRERDFLAMLHLLDPDTYDLDDLDWFKERVASREEMAEAMLALAANKRTFLLAGSVPRLRETFAHDERMLGLLTDLEGALDGPDEKRERILSDARAHISETYRLHHRLLRNRRAAIMMDAYRVRGRGALTVIADPDPRRALVDRWLSDWRATLLNDALEGGGEGAVDAALAAFRVYASYGTGDPLALAELLLFRLTRRTRWREAASLSAEAAAALTARPLSDAQRASAQELLESLGYEETTETFEATDHYAWTRAQLLTLKHGVYLVFASAHSTADALADALERHGEQVFRCTSAMDPEHRHREITSFRDASNTRILVCDSTGEEGLNLQVADAVIHLDLPWSVSRIEQRIGRADRFGAGPAVRNIVITSPNPETISHWWFSALRDAFHVFEQTTTSTQYAIETVERDLFSTLLEDGLAEANRALNDVEQRVREEQERIDRIDSLDALARQDSDDLEFIAEVAEADRTLAGAFGQDTLAAVKANREALWATTTTLGAGSWRLVMDGGSAALQLFPGLPEVEHEVTADRATAVDRPSVSLLRPGAPIVEVLRIQQDADPTRQTCAVWRAANGEEEDSIIVRCDFVIEADPSPAFEVWNQLEAARPRHAAVERTDADAPLALAALKRRLDGYLAPLPMSIWINHAGEVVEPGGDNVDQDGLPRGESLGPLTATQRLALAQRFGAPSMEDLLEAIGAAAQQAALASEVVPQAVDAATARARQAFEEVVRVLRLRLDNDHSEAARRDLRTEELVAEPLLAALARPTLRPSAACLLAITHDPPERW